TNHRAGILVDRALDDSLVVVDEQARRCKDVGQRLLHLIDLERAANRVRRAAPQVPLVVPRRTALAQVDALRQRADFREWCRVDAVAMNGEIRYPSIPPRGPLWRRGPSYSSR